MTSSYSTDLKLELMVTGANAGTWGDNTNNNLNLIQQAISGFEQVTLSSGGTLALAMTDKTISNARNMVIKFATASIAASTICTIPDSIEKFYIFDATGLTNPTNLTIKTASGTGFALDAAKIYAAYSDGTNLNEISLDTLGGTIGTAQIADDAVTLAKMAPGTDGNIISYDASGNPVAVATGTAGQILTSAGAGAPPTFSDPSSGGTSWVTTPKTATFTAVSGEGYFCNTSAGAFNMTLPASPTAGDFVAVKDYAKTFTSYGLTIDRNSSPINGGNTVNPTLSTAGQSVVFVYVDATKGWIPTQDDSSEISGAILYVQSSVTGCGNTLTTSSCGDYKIATFIASGDFIITCAGSACGSNTIDYLVVGGGGGGNSSIAGGGGGGGGFRYSALAADQPGAPALPLNACAALPSAAATYPVVIGAGGTGSPSASGVDTVFRTITSAGGGASNNAGGSGGGKQHRGGAGGAGNTPPVSPPQGNPGGEAITPSYSGSGGGGAMAAGNPSQPPLGNGPGGFGGAGGGVPSVVFGTSGESSGGFYYFSGGGGGGAAGPGGTPGAGGLGGGGAALAPGTGNAGTANTGGGGAGNTNSAGTGAAGGSGIVIIRYKFLN